MLKPLSIFSGVLIVFICLNKLLYYSKKFF